MIRIILILALFGLSSCSPIDNKMEHQDGTQGEKNALGSSISPGAPGSHSFSQPGENTVHKTPAKLLCYGQVATKEENNAADGRVNSDIKEIATYSKIEAFYEEDHVPVMLEGTIVGNKYVVKDITFAQLKNDCISSLKNHHLSQINNNFVHRARFRNLDPKLLQRQDPYTPEDIIWVENSRHFRMQALTEENATSLEDTKLLDIEFK